MGPCLKEEVLHPPKA